MLHRLVVIEFPTMESFENWYSSNAYAPWKKIRQELSETDFFVVEGLTVEESKEIAPLLEFQEIHNHSYRFQNWGIIRKKT